MKCPDDTHLALWLEGRLLPAHAEAIQSHIEVCLACRLVIGPDHLHPAFQSGEPPAAGSGVPFSRIRERLRDAFWMTHDVSQDAIAAAAFAEDMPVRLAADSRGRASATSIPSHNCEEGRLVVTFRLDAPSGVVTAHLVSQDPVRIAFRALFVGDRIFLSDTHGKAALTGLSFDELVGMRIAVLPIVGQVSLESSALEPVGTIRDLVFHDDNGREVPLATGVQLATEVSGTSLHLALEGMSFDELGLVAVFDETAAQFSLAGIEGSVNFSWPETPPGHVRIIATSLP